MGNGFPLGGIMISQNSQLVTDYGTTFGGNHLACAPELQFWTSEKQQLMDNDDRLRLFSGSNQTNP
jgi:acetylornithine/succinyldiaminopimelate/putrescine aminotransferase